MDLKKHAFLIVAHEDLQLLQELVSLLDDDRNDVYVLVDSASRLHPQRLTTARSGLTILPRMRVYWGGLSLIQAELRLLRAASAGGYHYYHLLSGSDLPLVVPERLHERLEDSALEYVDIDPGCESFARWKVGPYHLLVETGPYRAHRTYRLLSHALAKLQTIAGIDRTRSSRFSYYHGSAFFSITHAFAEYLLRRERWVNARFRYTVIGEEVFMQTLLMRSPFQPRLAGRGGLRSGNLRYIDWNRRRGNSPHTFRMSDYQNLREASRRYLFARKFSRASDSEVINAIGNALRSRGEL